MDCSDIRDVFLAGELPTGADAEEHVRECLQCRQLIERRGVLGQGLGAASEQATPPDLLAAVERDLERERGARAWLRSRSTRLRLALVLLTVSGVFTSICLLAPRPDFAIASDERWFALAGLLVFGVVLGAGGALRSLGRAQPLSLVGVALAVLLLPLLSALLPEAESHHPQLLTEADPGFATRALRCFFFGVLLSAPAGTLLWFASREDRLPPGTLIFAAGASGVVANLALHAHCPLSYPGHLIAGHGTVGIAWLLALLLMNRLSRAG